MFSFCKEFREIWEEIPYVATYRQYVETANKIDTYRMANLITKTDERVLLNCLEAFVDSRYAPKSRAEWKQMYEQEEE